MNPLNTRTRRRAGVAVGAGAFVWGTVAGATGAAYALVPLAVAISCAFLVTHAARAYGVGRKRVDGRVVDERMAQVRDRAMAQAYRIVSLLLLIVTANWLPVDRSQVTGAHLSAAALLLVTALPQALIIRNEPEALADDQAQDQAQDQAMPSPR
jgi:uncharacterized membrane protein